jgi:hypothetical protein
VRVRAVQRSRFLAVWHGALPWSERADARRHYARRRWPLDGRSGAATMEPTRRWACSGIWFFSSRLWPWLRWAP